MQPVQLPEHRIETRRVADLVPADYNPRKISPKAMEGLKKSLAEFGAVQPIVVNERTGHIVGGHQRVKALAALGQVETTVIVVDLSLTREKALNVALNNPHISGEFDDGLGDLLDEINGEMPELFADLRLDELLAPGVDIDPGDGELKDLPDAPPSARGVTFALTSEQIEIVTAALNSAGSDGSTAGRAAALTEVCRVFGQ